MKSVKILLLLIGFSATWVQAQIATRMDQYYLEPSIINAAAINTQNNTSVGLFFNKLFAGVDGSPSNFLINVASHKLGKNFGFGGNFAVESIGFINNYNGYASYAYTLPLRGSHKFTFAPTLGFIAQRLNTSAINVVNTNDPQYQALINGQKDTRFDLKLSGLYEYKGLMIGLSSGRITKPKFQYESGSQVANFATRNLSNLFVSTKLQIASEVVLQPVLSATMFDFKEPLMQYGVNLFMAETMWAGLHYAGNKNLSLNVGGRFKDVIRVGYSFSLPVSSASRLLGTGHEVYVNYAFGAKAKNPLDLSNRFVLNNANIEQSDTNIAAIDNNIIAKMPSYKPDVDTNKAILNPPKIDAKLNDTQLAVGNVPKPKVPIVKPVIKPDTQLAVVNTIRPKVPVVKPILTIDTQTVKVEVAVINKFISVQQPVLKPGQILVNDLDMVVEALGATGNDIDKMVPVNLPLVHPVKGFYLCISFAKTEADANLKMADYWKEGVKAFKVYYPKNQFYYIYVDRFDDNYSAEQAKWSGKYGVSNIWNKLMDPAE